MMLLLVVTLGLLEVALAQQRCCTPDLWEGNLHGSAGRVRNHIPGTERVRLIK